MVVLAIVILLAAAVLPTLGPMRRQGRLRAAANTVAGSLRSARSLAIARSDACYVYAVDAPDPDEVLLYLAPFEKPEAVERLPEGVSFVGSLPDPGDVWFLPDGSCSTSLVLRVKGEGREEYRITVSAASGRVSVRKVKQ
jgi:type II secretory pathway pseudopilin PulG